MIEQNSHIPTAILSSYAEVPLGMQQWRRLDDTSSISFLLAQVVQKKGLGVAIVVDVNDFMIQPNAQQ